MKNLIVLTAIILLSCLQCLSASNLLINELENNLFGYDYSTESDSKRIERIEEYLYGTKKSGSLSKRIENIQNDIGYIKTEEIAEINEEKKKIEQEKIEAERKEKIKSIKEDESVDYPIIDKIEKIVFNQSYVNEDIYQRLDRIENRVFNKTNDSMALTDRVNKLSDIILPQNNTIAEENIPNRAQMTEIYNSGIPTTNSQSIPFQIAVLEQNMLNNTYNNDHIANRLARLENELFKRTFANDTDTERLQRIMVTYEAKQNSYKYENNRKMQKMATASQFGGILLMILAMLL